MQLPRKESKLGALAKNSRQASPVDVPTPPSGVEPRKLGGLVGRKRKRDSVEVRVQMGGSFGQTLYFHLRGIMTLQYKSIVLFCMPSFISNPKHISVLNIKIISLLLNIFCDIIIWHALFDCLIPKGLRCNLCIYSSLSYDNHLFSFS